MPPGLKNRREYFKMLMENRIKRLVYIGRKSFEICTLSKKRFIFGLGAKHSGLSSPCMCRDPVWSLVLIPATLLPTQLPACGLGKRLRMDQSLGTLHPCGRPRRAPGSWLQIGSAPAVVLTWVVNHRTEDGLMSLKEKNTLLLKKS